MAKLGYSYLPRPIINSQTVKIEEVFTPFVPIRVSLGHGSPSRIIDALVDSGSDMNLFPLGLGELLGINFKKLTYKIIHGIGKAEVKAYTHKINVWLNNVKYETTADFCTNQQVLLLGRNGFFNLFKTLTFDENGRFLYIQTY